jgi:ribonucleoside-diphosphate reductase alpha chain
MAELKGVFVMGATWELANFFGRGEPREEIEKLRDDPTTSPIFFAQNYLSHWVGASDGALVNISKVMSLRTLTEAEVVGDEKYEYIIAMDVARSESKANNQSSIVVLKIIRAKNGRIIRIHLVLIKNLEAGLNFQGQAVELKRVKKAFNAKMVIVDGNGLGSGLVDECLKETIDPNSGESLGCWNTINTENQPELDDAEKCLFDLKAQGVNSDIITAFIDAVESGRLQLLEKRMEKFSIVNDKDATKEKLEKEWFPFKQTDILIEEIANLKREQLPSGKQTVKRVTKRVDKDRYSALAYALWYVKAFEDGIITSNEDNDVTDFLLIN